MITKLKRGFKMATVQRQRRAHREALLLQRIEETNKRLNNLLKEEELKLEELTKRLNLMEL